MSLNNTWPDPDEVERVLDNAIKVLSGPNRSVFNQRSKLKRFDADFGIRSDAGEIPPEEVALIAIFAIKPSFLAWLKNRISGDLNLIPVGTKKDFLLQLRSVI